jgi:hypothetical protein
LLAVDVLLNKEQKDDPPTGGRKKVDQGMQLVKQKNLNQ